MIGGDPSVIYNGHYGYLDDIADTVRNVERILRPHRSRFDFIVATGMSGVLVGSPLAMRLRRPLVVVRKPADDNHSGHDLVGYGAAVGRYLFLDDFISFGTTYRRVRDRMDGQSTYAGTYLYSDDVLSWDGDGIITYRPPDLAERFGDISINRALAYLGVTKTPETLAA